MDYLPFFVYGTLKRGEPNYVRYLTGQTASEQAASLPGAALFTAGPYPFLVREPDLVAPTAVVVGELVSLRLAVYQLVLADLDRLEGYVPGGSHNLYERLITTVTTADGPREAWVYVAGAATLAQIRAGQLHHIPSGNWGG
ncbi:MAG: gamma-glutamylcyclotransferase family protein [Oscillochloridaceae bacterium umkhey_bin13]